MAGSKYAVGVAAQLTRGRAERLVGPPMIGHHRRPCRAAPRTGAAARDTDMNYENNDDDTNTYLRAASWRPFPFS